MNCTSCGAELPDGAAFCPECGAAKVGMKAAPGMTDGSARSGAAPEADDAPAGGALGRVWASMRSVLSK